VLVRRLKQRETKGERRTARRARDRDVTTHCKRELAHDREPETGAYRTVAVVTPIEEEAIEHTRNLVGRDAWARVFHRQLAGSGGQRDRAAGRRTAQRILDEVRHRLQQAVAIGQRRNGLVVLLNV